MTRWNFDDLKNRVGFRVAYSLTNPSSQKFLLKKVFKKMDSSTCKALLYSILFYFKTQ